MDIEKIINEVIKRANGIVVYIISCIKQEGFDNYWVVYTFDKDLIVEGFQIVHNKIRIFPKGIYNNLARDEESLIKYILETIKEERII